MIDLAEFDFEEFLFQKRGIFVSEALISKH
jgi:hypothetical protein